MRAESAPSAIRNGKRGRKPIYLCPPIEDLRQTINSAHFLTDVASHYGVPLSTLYRWMTECDFEIHAARKHRAHGEVPAYVRVARQPSGKRVSCRLYSVWTNMLKRCYSPSNVNYRWYGARGIVVCDAWRDFDNFRAWAVPAGFVKDITLDRIDSNGNYEPSNCRFVGRDVQQQNMRRRGPLPRQFNV